MSLGDLIPVLRGSLAARLEPGIWPRSAQATNGGQFLLGGVRPRTLVERFGTPMVAVDTVDVQARCRAYRAALPGAEIVYTGARFPPSGLMRLIDREGLSLGLRSGYDVARAVGVGFPAERLLLHADGVGAGELAGAVAHRVGRVVLSGTDDIWSLASVLSGQRRQDVLLRVVPELDPRAASAGRGLAVASGRAMAAVRRVLEQPRLRLVGLHCHLGSQVRHVGHYQTAALRLVELASAILSEHDVVLGQLNLGGGHAVARTVHECSMDLGLFAHTVPGLVSRACRQQGYPAPRLSVEPGRALVARAGVRLCRVLAVERRASGLAVVVDGPCVAGMAGLRHPERFPVRLIGRPGSDRREPVTMAWHRHGHPQVLPGQLLLPADVTAGDLLATPVAGADPVGAKAGCAVVAVSAGVAFPL